MTRLEELTLRVSGTSIGFSVDENEYAVLVEGLARAVSTLRIVNLGFSEGACVRLCIIRADFHAQGSDVWSKIGMEAKTRILEV